MSNTASSSNRRETEDRRLPKGDGGREICPYCGNIGLGCPWCVDVKSLNPVTDQESSDE